MGWSSGWGSVWRGGGRSGGAVVVWLKRWWLRWEMVVEVFWVERGWSGGRSGVSVEPLEL